MPAARATAKKARGSTKKAPARQPRKNSRAANNAQANGKRDPKPTPEGELSATAIGKGIGRYLTELRSKPKGNGGVSLGALPGFPGWTKDPAVVNEAIKMVEQKMIAAPSAVAQLKCASRIADLRDQLKNLDVDGKGNSARDFFVEHAAEWAANNHIQYSAFRTMGVPADVMKEAGILR